MQGQWPGRQQVHGQPSTLLEVRSRDCIEQDLCTRVLPSVRESLFSEATGGHMGLGVPCTWMSFLNLRRKYVKSRGVCKIFRRRSCEIFWFRKKDGAMVKDLQM